MNTQYPFHLAKWYARTFGTTRKLISENRSFCRHLSSAQVTTALRPFYFLVHPDLFGQFPRAQHINDSSLKSLNSHLDSLINHKKPRPVSIQFYVRDKHTQGILHTVAVQLNKPTARATVHGILSEFDLPTNYVDSLPRSSGKPDREIKWHHSFYDATGTINPEQEPYVAKTRESLYSWLIKNMGEAERRLSVSKPIRQDIVRLRLSLMEELKLKELTWERGLGTTHLRGCMQGLAALMAHHQEIKEVLEGRSIHFGNETGISLSGSLVLSTSEVRNQWLKVIHHLPEQDAIIRRIPDMQKAVSNALRNIQVTHRKYQPFLLAENYSQQLRRFVTALGDYRGRNGYPKSWPESLSKIQLVVESASGPLMVSPTGQILVPSSCPPGQLVNFITENMGEAEKMINKYKSVRWREKTLHRKCKEELGLEFMEKDDSVTPDMMAECLERLLEASYRLSPLLCGARVWVTHYYTVMLDGEICIPWNWDKEKF